VIALLLASMVAAAAVSGPADLVFRGGRIHTVVPDRVPAQGLAVKDGRVLAVGRDETVMQYVGLETRIVDLAGATVLPGLIDSHGHMLNFGNRLNDVMLVGTVSYQAVIDSVVARARVTPRGEWILGRGWDQNDWPETAMPTHDALSRAVPDHPVRLTRIDGHASLVNALAMTRAGLTRATRAPAGGEILRGRTGEPTGVLVDAARGLVESVIPPITAAERERRLLDAMQECARLGLTMVHDAGIGVEDWQAYHALLARGPLPIRVYAMAVAGSPLLDTLLACGPELGDQFTLRAVKIVADGALGSRGALLGRPYSDAPGTFGLATFPLDRMRSVAERALAAGLQVRVHAIGDSANHGTLDVFEQVFAGRPRPELRWAIEHAQIVRPEDVRRFALLGIVASMQPTHATSDGPWAESRLGPERVTWGYTWRSFAEAGVPVVSGSDFPVESANPMLGLYAAITRKDLDGKLPAEGWFPEQRMSLHGALYSFTTSGAWLAFRENDLGSLREGHLADFIVLDRDVLTGPADQIPQAKVLRTVVGGRTVFEAKPE
jgi:predicted amidohydrolase YtcJ